MAMSDRQTMSTSQATFAPLVMRRAVMRKLLCDLVLPPLALAAEGSRLKSDVFASEFQIMARKPT